MKQAHGKGRIWRIAITLAILATALVVPSSVPANATVSYCGSRTKHWNIKDGSISIYVAWVEMNIEVCHNGVSITSTSSWTQADTTGPGQTAGFVVGIGRPALTSFYSGSYGWNGYAGWTAHGTLRDCLPGGITVWCSYTEDWVIRGRLTMLNLLAPYQSGEFYIGNRRFVASWSWACTNNVCGVHLS